MDGFPKLCSPGFYRCFTNHFFFVSIVTISQLRNISVQDPQTVNDRHGAVYWVSSCHARWFVSCRFGCWNQYDLRTAVLNVFVM
jgi:hypothetical protein